jgi:hypothetical protein
MISSVVQIVGALGVVVSLFLLAWQTRKLGRQIAIGNVGGRYQSMGAANDRYHGVLQLIFQNPELRPYLYDEKPCSLEDPNRDRLLMACEMLADSIDHAMSVTNRYSDVPHYSGWESIARFYYRQPIFSEAIELLPYFPDLNRYLSGIESQPTELAYLRPMSHGVATP